MVLAEETAQNRPEEGAVCGCVCVSARRYVHTCVYGVCVCMNLHVCMCTVCMHECLGVCMCCVCVHECLGVGICIHELCPSVCTWTVCVHECLVCVYVLWVPHMGSG